MNNLETAEPFVNAWMRENDVTATGPQYYLLVKLAASVMETNYSELIALRAERDALRELHAAARKIVLMDNDAHPGLASWHMFRAKAHKEAEAALDRIDKLGEQDA